MKKNLEMFDFLLKIFEIFNKKSNKKNLNFDFCFQFWNSLNLHLLSEIWKTFF